MLVDPNSAKAIFMTAVDMSDPAERAAYLAEACGDEGMLRRRVEVLLKTVEAIKTQRDRIVAELPRLGLTPVPSDANFVLFGGLADEQAGWQRLLDHGVLVRDVGLPGHLRVTAGTPAETDAFLAALAAIVSPIRPEEI